MNEIISSKGYSNQVGILVNQMIYTRENLIKLTRNLSQENLDFNFDSMSNSIGTLLLHIAALEFKFLLNNFSYDDFDEKVFEEISRAAPFNMNKRLVYGYEFDYYFKYLNKFRKETLLSLRKVDDNWLFKKVKTNNGEILGNNYYLLRHIIDDEISHQGQIKIILNRIS
ncbi:DinB family protein [uncultured Tenacibaculum sp.]|uniref:DinB family protein n=1 Tax=uncultured Tenacibaculum sp. TaxID=174713 RepID=UPI002620C5CB|nr:DinB family protein [uncultured Tenacibaculum sp.]